MKYICSECGKVIDDDDVVCVEESRGEYWGSPCCEKMYYSPCCNAGIEDFYPTCEYCRYFKDNYCEFKEEEVEKNDLCKEFEME